MPHDGTFMPTPSPVPKPREISEVTPDPQPRFTVCTMVTRPAQYQEMLASFEAAGFHEPMVEYLYVDNSSVNRLDAFAAIRRFLALARGRYVIVCHQDVRLDRDGMDRLEACVRELDHLDPHWALLGNAGGEAPFRTVVRITDRKGESAPERLPRRVQSLDENFILVRRDSNPGISRDLQGFHLYGLDLCRQAALRGYRAYVVDFHLTHLGAGKLDASFWEARAHFVEKYRRAMAGAYYQTTSTTLYLSGSALWSALMNSRHVMKWRKSLSKRLGRADRERA